MLGVFRQRTGVSAKVTRARVATVRLVAVLKQTNEVGMFLPLLVETGCRTRNDQPCPGESTGLRKMVL